VDAVPVEVDVTGHARDIGTLALVVDGLGGIAEIRAGEGACAVVPADAALAAALLEADAAGAAGDPAAVAAHALDQGVADLGLGLVSVVASVLGREEHR
jgi:hypothetical protein